MSHEWIIHNMFTHKHPYEYAASAGVPKRPFAPYQLYLGDNMTHIHLKGLSKAKYLDSNKRRCSIIIKRNRKDGIESFDYIRIGSSFSRTRDDRAIEYVSITGLSTDSFGIPHIRYDAHSRSAFTTQPNYDGSKMLSLPAFIKSFHK